MGKKPIGLKSATTTSSRERSRGITSSSPPETPWWFHEDCGLWNADCGLEKKTDLFSLRLSFRNPKSAFRNRIEENYARTELHFSRLSSRVVSSKKTVGLADGADHLRRFGGDRPAASEDLSRDLDYSRSAPSLPGGGGAHL